MGSPTLQARRDTFPTQVMTWSRVETQVMTWSRVEERHVARMETTTQIARSIFGISQKEVLRSARIRWMGQAAVFTGSTSTAAPRATSGLHGPCPVATEPRGHLGC